VVDVGGEIISVSLKQAELVVLLIKTGEEIVGPQVIVISILLQNIENGKELFIGVLKDRFHD